MGQSRRKQACLQPFQIGSDRRARKALSLELLPGKKKNSTASRFSADNVSELNTGIPSPRAFAHTFFYLSRPHLLLTEKLPFLTCEHVLCQNANTYKPYRAFFPVISSTTAITLTSQQPKYSTGPNMGIHTTINMNITSNPYAHTIIKRSCM